MPSPNSSAGIDDTAPRVAEGRYAGLGTRVASAIVMAVVALSAIHFNTLAFGAFVAAGAAVLCWEWVNLCRAGTLAQMPGALLVAGVLAALVLAIAGLAAVALGVAALTALAMFAARGRVEIHPLWLAGGAVYIALPTIALVWLRGGASGEAVILWLMATVWVTDIAAFFAGRSIGGPRLAPRISPRKTWAGLLGAVGGAALFGAAVGAGVGNAPPAGWLALAGGLLAVVAQMGDLGESWVKRRFGAKDSSALIPGHGGLLDRVDGLLAAAVVVAAWQWASDGGGILAWR